MRVWFLDFATSGMELSFTEKGKTAEESVGREIHVGYIEFKISKQRCQKGSWVSGFEFWLLI